MNTIFEVAHQRGLRTAWSDKHPAYDILNGPSGVGVDDLFTPEIDSTADSAGDSWTDVNSLTQRYDGFKVRALVNEIDGLDHSGAQRVGVPAIFGMNFQSVSTAEKLPESGGQPGGYNADGTPGPVLRSALSFVDRSIASMRSELARQHLTGSTTIILSAKHGQSPIDKSSLKRIDDATMLADLDIAWQRAGHSGPLVAGSLDDDGVLLWLKDRSATATSFAQRFLLSYNGNGTGARGRAKATDSSGAPVAYRNGGLRAVFAGTAAAQFIGVHPGDSRVPDLIGLVQHGVVYTGSTSKIAEHGGDDPQDRHVALVIAGAGVQHGSWSGRVSTIQIAPTILSLLGIPTRSLQAVRRQHTAVLHGA